MASALVLKGPLEPGYAVWELRQCSEKPCALSAEAVVKLRDRLRFPQRPSIQLGNRALESGLQKYRGLNDMKRTGYMGGKF